MGTAAARASALRSALGLECACPSLERIECAGNRHGNGMRPLRANGKVDDCYFDWTARAKRILLSQTWRFASLFVASFQDTLASKLIVMKLYRSY